MVACWNGNVVPFAGRAIMLPFLVRCGGQIDHRRFRLPCLLDGVLQGCIDRVWESVDFIKDDSVECLVKAEQLVGGGDGQRGIEMAVFTAAIKGSNRYFREYLFQARGEFKDYIGPRCGEADSFSGLEG